MGVGSGLNTAMMETRLVRSNAAAAATRTAGPRPRFSRILRSLARLETAPPGWHYLDTGDELARLGVPSRDTSSRCTAIRRGPTSGAACRGVGAAAEAGSPAWRVVAVDQLEMGFSERTGMHRPLAQRVADLAACTDASALDGPVVTLGHDWGGVVSLGWAIDHPRTSPASCC